VAAAIKPKNMAKTGYITARVEPKLKARAGRVLAKSGVTTTQAITMFLTQIVLNEGLPFDVRVPHAQTRKVVEELENPVKRAKLKRYATTGEMLGDVLPKQGHRANRKVREPSLRAHRSERI
jgi:addiction module RelB/DinJ family antitoxin